jgi:hypothetical protein
MKTDTGKISTVMPDETPGISALIRVSPALISV